MGDSFMDLVVWQRAVELSTEIYRLTATYPKSEQYGLVNQMRRASVSIASNIAEGYGKRTKGEYLQSLAMPEGQSANCKPRSSSQNRLASAWALLMNDQST